MKIEGTIRKMRTEYNVPVQYYLPIDEKELYMNEIIGLDLTLEATGAINCIRCGKPTKNSFAQGYCYQCFSSAPEAEECVLRPELCRAHEGIARDMEYARTHCLIDHYVYLALTPAIKVGVTRNTQIPTRWIDQGADRAIRLALTPNRFKAGLIEVALKQLFSDKTNWRQMLSGIMDSETELQDEKWKVEELLPMDFRNYFCDEDEVIHLTYPVTSYPQKIKSVDLDKQKISKVRLTGIKGQYLLFASGEVLNIRKYGGYHIRLEY